MQLAKNPGTAVCESKNNALADPTNVLHSTETTDGVPQSEKTSLLFLHPGGTTPTSAHPETDGTYMTMNLNLNYMIFILCLI